MSAHAAPAEEFGIICGMEKRKDSNLILVGTYRSENAAWVREKRLYNLPISAASAMGSDSMAENMLITRAGEAYGRFKSVVLFAGDAPAMAFAASFREVVDGAWLKANGYAVAKTPHGTRYALFALGEKLSAAKTLSDPTAEVWVCSTRWTGKIDVDFYSRPLPACGGKSIPNIFEKLRPYFRKWKSAQDFNPVQVELFEAEMSRPMSCSRNAWDKDVEVEKSSYLWTKEPLFIKRKEPLRKGRLNVLELFCGCGGTSCGFEMAGYQTALGVDILEPAITTFCENHRTASAYLGDVREISAEDILSHVGCSVDVVIAGIPCQGFSLNNRKRHDSDSRNELYLELLRILRTVRPRAVVVENVSGIRSSGNGQVVAKIERGIFEACGLTVRHQMLNAADYGVPQRRQRVVLIGVQDAQGFDFADIAKTNGPGTERPYVTVREAIGDLPTLESGQVSAKYTKPPSCEYQRQMRANAKVLTNHVAPTHPQATIDKIASTKPGSPMYPAFRQRIRLAWDIQSPTQVSGGIRPQFQFGHPEQARGLTIRERCRIQSFPDTFRVSGGLVQGRVQTGNAVPPLLAEAIAKALRKYL